MKQGLQLILLSAAARTLPTVNGKSITSNTLWRWATCGVNGTRLQTRRIGGRILTTREYLVAFLRTTGGVDNV